jgi:hypothetical protein
MKDFEDINIAFVAIIIVMTASQGLLLITCKNCADDNLTFIGGPAICIQPTQ